MRSEPLKLLRPLWLVTIAAILPGCFHDENDSPNFRLTTTPAIEVNKSGMAPLTAIVSLETDQPTRAILTVSDGSSSSTIDFVNFATDHDLPVLGLKPNRTYTIDVALVDDQERVEPLGTPLTAITDPLPDDMPVIELLHSDPAKMEPGYTLLGRFSRGRGVDGNLYTIAVDNAGEVVWYSMLGRGATKQAPNGDLAYRENNDVVSVDMLGNETSRITLEYDGVLHHDLIQSSRGTWLSLGRNDVLVEDFPTSDTDPDAPPMDTVIVDEPGIEFAADGSFLTTWPLTEMIHPQRIAFSSLGRRRGEGPDWVHTNAITEDTRDDTILISARHQDAVIKYFRESGELKWILGPHENWPEEFHQYLLTPVGAPFEWQYHQHNQMTTQDGTLLLYDNGNFRASPFEATEPLEDAENYSRAVEYEIDEQAMTVRQVWEYGGTAGERLYTPAQGGVAEMPVTKNVLVNFAWVAYADGVPGADLGFGTRHVRVIEVTRETPAEKVFDLRMYQQDPEAGITVYRSQRIPSLYSPDVAIER